MISTNELVYRFKLEYDKLDSNDYPDLPLPAILIILNRAIVLYVQKCYGINNTYNIGVEGNQKRMDDLQMLIVKDEPSLTYTQDTLDPLRYVADFSNLTKGKYLHLLRSSSTGNKYKCINSSLYNKQITHDELDEVLIDPNRSPSFEWQEIPVILSDNKIYGYTDGTFSLNKCFIEYLKYPKEIDLQGYIKFDGTNSANIDSELPDYVLQDIVTIGVRIAQGNIGNTEGYKISQNEIQNQE